LAGLPDRRRSPQTIKGYRKTFRAMWREKTLDPLRPDDARRTYQRRRAVLHWGAYEMLTHLLAKIEAAIESGDREIVQRLEVLVSKVVDRLAPALALDPPMRGEVPDFKIASRWKNSKKIKKKHRKRDKKRDLAKLPISWREQVWSKIPENFLLKDVFAVHSLSPARGGELQPGMRPTGFSEGVIVALTKRGHLVLATRPLKTHDGKFGQDICAVKIDVSQEGPIAEYLAQRCRAKGGKFIVSVPSSDAVRKAIMRIGRDAFPHGPVICPLLYRHQRVADMKVAFGAGGETAVGAGQGVDDTQSVYGNAAHGRAGGLIGAFGNRAPRLVAVCPVGTNWARRVRPLTRFARCRNRSKDVTGLCFETRGCVSLTPPPSTSTDVRAKCGACGSRLRVPSGAHRLLFNLLRIG